MWANDDVAHAQGVVWRRRQRQLQAHWRHEQLTLQMLLATFEHHAAPRGQSRASLQRFYRQSILPETAPRAPRSAGQPGALTWEPIGPPSTASFWERTEAPLPPLRPRCNFIHTKQLSPFLERLVLPFPSEEILSGFEDIVSSGTDQFTAWVKTDPHATMVRHMVDVKKSHCRLSRGIRMETRYVYPGIPLQPKIA